MSAWAWGFQGRQVHVLSEATSPPPACGRAQHRTDARMGVLHVVHRVVVVLGHRQIHVKGVFGVGLALRRKKRTASLLVHSIRSRSVT